MPADKKSSQDGSASSKPSLWERIGRTTGKGFRAAKALGDRMENEAEASQRLDACYAKLGRVVAEQLGTPDSSDAAVVRAEDPAIRPLLEELDALRVDLEQLKDDDSAESDSE